MTSSQASGQSQAITITGTFDPNPSTVSVQFLNDAYGGAAGSDRNLYVDGVTLDGTTVSGAAATIDPAVGRAGAPAFLFTNGTATFDLPGAPSATASADAVPSTALLASYMAAATTTAPPLVSDPAQTTPVPTPAVIAQSAHA